MVLDDSWRAQTEKFGHAGVRPVHLVAFGLAILNFIPNALIWYAFHACAVIINKSRLHLFYALAVTNCLTGLFSVPTFINLFLHNNFNCPKWTIMIGSAFEMALNRTRGILALAIAFDRLFAIFRPHAFFLSNRKKIRTHCVSTSSSGPLFHSYFLVMSFIDGFGLLVAYVIFLVKVVRIRKSIADPEAKKSLSPGMRDLVTQVRPS
ncbi:hypothetical protein PMAYCL1PPCAC_31706 [Pristionchus mayeri]|uniref:G protein-coupled receptor n=1 Tax=Pristionchus mayeri TaxID=1317129 RepID=A0AAN5DEH1_9BILA|nr:hypothetical protein PMAYCL1PPCAC_31706 [Pristionchus mayeri]